MHEAAKTYMDRSMHLTVFFVGDTRMQSPGLCKLCERKNVSTFNELKLGESKS
jgi:hypothetical protein